MTKTQIYAIIVVVIIVVAACAVVLVVSGDDDDDDDYTLSDYADVGVLIYGNANNDNYIDSEDVNFVQDIIDGNVTWDSDAYPFADADTDGDIDEDDIALIEKIINDEECTIYYLNYFEEVQAINFPLVDNNIMVTYWQQAEAMSILGHWDEVVVASAAVTLYPDLYPTDGIEIVGTTGSSSKAVEDTEVIIENDVDLIIATASTSVRSGLSTIEADDTLGIQIIYLWHSGDDVTSTILTLGVMMCEEETAEAYYDYVTSNQAAITDVVSELDEDEVANILALIVYSNTAERYESNGGYCVMLNDNEGAYYLLSLLGNMVEYDGEVTEWGYQYLDIEWFLEHDSEIEFMINCESSIGFNDGSTADAYNERFETNAALFSEMTCYSEGKIIGSVYTFLGGFSGTAMLPLLGYMIYPDLFTLEDALESLQYWFDTFTDADVDVTTFGAYYYTGTNYDIWYNQ